MVTYSIVVIILNSLLMPLTELERFANVQVTHPNRLKTSQNLLIKRVVAYENLSTKENTSKQSRKVVAAAFRRDRLRELLITAFKARFKCRTLNAPKLM